VLTIWTVVDPLRYERKEVMGIGGWDRVIETYGACRSEKSEASYILPIVVLDIGVLVLANWQAFEARHIEAEFSETRYIAICMASMLQAVISGIPVLFVVKEDPRAWYLVLVFMIFIIGMVILLVIFIPKILFTQLFLSKTKQQQNDIISFIIQRSSKSSGNRAKKWSGHPAELDTQPHPSSQTPITTGGFQSRWALNAQSPGGNNFHQSAPPSLQPSAYQVDQVTRGNASSGVGYTATVETISENPGQRQKRSTIDSSISSFANGGLENANDSQSFGASVLTLSYHDASDSERSRQSFPVYGPSAHNASLVLDESDDPSQGMLVFRTVSITMDGRLPLSSLRSSSHSRFRPMQDESHSSDGGVTFFSGAGWSGRTLMSRGESSQGVMTSRLSNTTPNSCVSNSTLVSGDGSTSVASQNSSTRPPSTKRRRVSRKSSNGPLSRPPRLPSHLLNAIVEKSAEESEESERSMDRDTSGKPTATRITSDLNMIPEADHHSDGGDSFKSAQCLHKSDQSLAVDDLERPASEAAGNQSEPTDGQAAQGQRLSQGSGDYFNARESEEHVSEAPTSAAPESDPLPPSNAGPEDGTILDGSGNYQSAGELELEEVVDC
jgi:7 transmembrane sweet-taste receptor of 3 GCPR